MTLVDTGPLVALFDPKDSEHERCSSTLGSIAGPLATTIPVLTEAFHTLPPDSMGSQALREFVQENGLTIWFSDQLSLQRIFELMEQYSDHPMDMADASLIAAAEILETRRILTLDRRDFSTYRIRKGHRFHPVEILPD
jgi:predicted nucleic acid-binding protein